VQLELISAKYNGREALECSRHIEMKGNAHSKGLQRTEKYSVEEALTIATRDHLGSRGCDRWPRCNIFHARSTNRLNSDKFYIYENETVIAWILSFL